MKKGIATAERLWDKYVICGCHLCLQRGVTMRTANGIFLRFGSVMKSTFGMKAELFYLDNELILLEILLVECLSRANS